MKKTLTTLLAVCTSWYLLAQNVGIGTTAPTDARLVVAAPSSVLLIAQNTNSMSAGSKSGIFLRNGNYFTGGLLSTATNTNFARIGLYTYASNQTSTLKERLTITDSGFVGINDSVAQTLLSIKGFTNYTDIQNSVMVNNARLVLNGFTGSTGALQVNDDATFTQSYVTIDNSSRLGIGVDPGWPLDILVNDGGMRIRDGNQAAGKVLTSDANGIARWQSNSKPKSLSGSLAATQAITGNNTFNTIAFVTNTGNGFNDITGSFNNTTSTFTVPAGEAGTYLVQMQVKWSLPNFFANRSLFLVAILKSGSYVAETSEYLLPDATEIRNRYMNLSTVVKLTAGQTISFVAVNYSPVSENISTDPENSFFNITKLY